MLLLRAIKRATWPRKINAKESSRLLTPKPLGDSRHASQEEGDEVSGDARENAARNAVRKARAVLRRIRRVVIPPARTAEGGGARSHEREGAEAPLDEAVLQCLSSSAAGDARGLENHDGDGCSPLEKRSPPAHFTSVLFEYPEWWHVDVLDQIDPTSTAHGDAASLSSSLPLSSSTHSDSKLNQQQVMVDQRLRQVLLQPHKDPTAQMVPTVQLIDSEGPALIANPNRREALAVKAFLDELCRDSRGAYNVLFALTRYVNAIATLTAAATDAARAVHVSAEHFAQPVSKPSDVARKPIDRASDGMMVEMRRG